MTKNPKTDFEKRSNALSREIAEKIYFKRMNSLTLKENQLFNKDVLEGDFINYSRNFILGKARTGTDVVHYNTTLKYLIKFCGSHLKFRQIDKFFLERFREFLLTTNTLRFKVTRLDVNSASSYFDKLLTLVEKAFKDNYLVEDTVTDVINLLGLPRHIIYAKAASGEIPSLKIGKRFKFRKKEVLEWFEGKFDTTVDVDDFIDKYLQRNVLSG